MQSATLPRVYKDVLIQRNVMQECLRPLLPSSRDFSDKILKALTRFLGLASSYMNVFYSERMMECLANWPDALSAAPRSTQISLVHEELSSGAALLNMFHRLPIEKADIAMYVDRLTRVVAIQEAKLHTYKYVQQLVHAMFCLWLRVQCHHDHDCMRMCVCVYVCMYMCLVRYVSFVCSPYRKPLARFLNRFPTEAIAHFMSPSQLTSPVMSSLFQCILKDVKECAALRAALTSDTGTESILITKIFNMQVCMCVHMCM